MSAPRVTFVSPHAVLGGAESVLLRLITRLGSARTAGVVLLQDGPLRHELQRAGIGVVVLPTGPRADMLVSAVRLRRVLTRQGPDVVHANGIKAAIVAGLAVAGRPTPMLWMRHDMAGAGRLAALAAARADLIVGVSDTVLRDLGPRTRAKRATVYNGVPDRTADREAGRALVQSVLGVGRDVPVVALAARLCTGKGQHELIAATPAILAAWPDAQIALVGGDDPAFPGHAQLLRTRARALGVADAVHLVGRREDVVEFMSGCDVVAVPSILDEAYGWREGFGLTPVEAMQMGTPVVAYASGALPEVLGDAAVLVPEGDRDGLARAIADLLGDPGRRASLADAGRARVADRFSHERSVDLMCGQYRMLAGCRR